MADTQTLKGFIEKLVEIVTAAESAGEGNAQKKLLFSLLPKLLTKNLSSVSQLQKAYTAVGTAFEDGKKEALTQYLDPGLSDTTCSQAVDPALLILETLIELLDSNINLRYAVEKADIDIANPPKDYWFIRTDGKGDHQFFTDGNYLVNSIPKAGTDTYYNAEIYNNPYTSILPKNVIVNPFPVDDPLKEPEQFIRDLFLNLPYAPQNKVVFQGSIQVDNLKGGSRGWGFWNTSVLPPLMQIAWFVQYDGTEQDGIVPLNESGFYAQTQNGLAGMEMPSSVRLPDLDEGRHDYRIELSKDQVEYFIDGKSVHREKDPNHIPDSPMAFHSWVDNAMFGLKDGAITHILQETNAPRSNTIQSMSIVSMPQPTSSALPFFTKQLLLPQSQSPEQLSAWVSSNHPDYDLDSWCIFGNLIDEQNKSVNAVSSIFQFQTTPTAGINLPLFESAFAYNGENTDGYLLCGTAGLSLSPSISITPDPWSIVVNYGQGPERSTICFSLMEGQIGARDTVYMMTADVHQYAPPNGGRLRAEIKLIDRLGIVNEGYGPSSFLPQWMTAEQQSAIIKKYVGFMSKYLDTTEDPMNGQGSYYYSAPMLDVQSFKIMKDKDVLSEGNRGTLWMDYVVQSFTQAGWTTVSQAGWEFFAIQLRSPQNSALMISEVTTQAPRSKLYIAKLFNPYGPHSSKTENGALNPDFEWAMDQIEIEPDKDSIWTGKTGAMYYLRYTITLSSTGGNTIVLNLSSIRKNQEIVVSDTAKYEGIFKVEGCITEGPVHSMPYEGYAWGEIHSI